MSFVPMGYLYKVLGPLRQKRLAKNVVNVYSLGHCSGCSARDFCDYTSLWKHNGFWLFNSAEELLAVAIDQQNNLSKLTMFYYEAYEKEFDFEGDDDLPVWQYIEPCPDFHTAVQVPLVKELQGYDVVEYSQGGAAECSLLSCSGVSETVTVNQNCLFATVEEAKASLENCDFHSIEPGPYRIVAVYLLA